MKQQEINTRVAQLLNDFEVVENMEPSREWEQSLGKKLVSARMHAPQNHQKIKLAIVATCFVFINAFLVVRFISTGSQKPVQHFYDLQSISNELLINSTASR